MWRMEQTLYKRMGEGMSLKRDFECEAAPVNLLRP